VRVPDLEDGLIFESFEQRVAKIFEKESLDQLMHGASAAAVRERYLLVPELALPSPRTLDALEER
jgi:hypothetical protein